MDTKYIAIFCSAKDVAEKYAEPAKQFCKLMVKNGYHLIWGGSDIGLMRTIASEVQNASANSCIVIECANGS
jgi:predicted Rossmann-fold nucleotide-binding protein